MSRFQFSTWFAAPHDKTGQEALGLLASAETAFWRMITGVFWLLFEGLPRWLVRQFQAMLIRFNRLVRFVTRIGIGLARLAVPTTIWVFILIAPMRMLPNVVFPLWVALVLGGSVYGVYRWQKKVHPPAPPVLPL